MSDSRKGSADGDSGIDRGRHSSIPKRFWRRGRGRRSRARDTLKIDPGDRVGWPRSIDRRQSRQSDWMILRRVFAESRPDAKQILALVALSLASTPLALLKPFPLKIAVDNALADEPLPEVLQWVLPSSISASATWLLGVAALLYVVIELLSRLQSLGSGLMSTYTGENITLRFRSRLLEHAQRLSFTFHDRRGSADSIYRIQSDAPAIQQISVQTVIPLFSAIVTLMSMIAVTLAINVQLGLIALSVTPFLYAFAYLYRKRMRPKYREVRQLESSAQNVVQEVLTSFRVVKAFGREDDEKRRFRDQSARGMQQRIRVAKAENAFALLLGMTTAVGTAGVVLVGGMAVQRGDITLGDLLVVLGYVAALYGPLYTITKRIAQLQSSFASAERAFELLDEIPDVQERPNPKRVRLVRGDVELRSVDFGYRDEELVLRDVSLRIPNGTRVGVFGPTGAGKTTLASLLTRFYDPTSGVILIDGVDIREYALADLRRQFGIMLQDPVLFSTSVRDNIAYADPSATERKVEEAARAAGAHEFIAALPDGYDTLVGERGMRLSGGERQRVSLARAFLKDAPILILDEPTSSVDVGTEEEIMTAMERLMAGKTSIMISHRPSTLAKCDMLVEIREGAPTVEVDLRPFPSYRQAGGFDVRAETRQGSSSGRDNGLVDGPLTRTGPNEDVREPWWRGP